MRSLFNGSGEWSNEQFYGESKCIFWQRSDPSYLPAGYQAPIPSLSRYGPIDELTFTYDGNRLQSVSDEIKKDLSYKDAMEFVDGSDASVEYSYDANGNMVWDKNKGISQISYNILNLARRIQKDDITLGPVQPSPGAFIPFWRDVVSTEYAFLVAKTL